MILRTSQESLDAIKPCGLTSTGNDEILGNFGKSTGPPGVIIFAINSSVSRAGGAGSVISASVNSIC